MIIYKVTNIVNGKMYIGQTVKSLRRRKQGHITDVKLHRNNFYFHNAIRNHGLRNFKWEIIHKCDDIGELNRLEIYYIGYYNTYVNGYNLTLGGGGSMGYKASAETRKKNSLATSGKNNPMYGKLGKDHPRFGYKDSDGTRKKKSLARSEKWCGKDHPMFGKKHSAESRKKMSEALVGKYTGKDSSSAKAILINNEYFDTLKKAAEFLGMTPASLRYRILHKTKWMDYHYV